MPLFVAEHHHRPETSPGCAAMRRQLLSHISAARAAAHGVTIEAEALIDGQHRLLLVLDAANAEAVTGFLGFLHDYGELAVLPASTAEQAAQREGCAAASRPGSGASR
jgi:hypothetical protein